MVDSESGCITIDGVDIGTLGLRHLRSQMSIIPQEPFLFSGTVRSNLDPFNSYTEPDLWRAVAAVGLKEAINALADGLDSHVVDGGNNFSQVRRCCQALPGPVFVGTSIQSLLPGSARNRDSISAARLCQILCQLRTSIQ
jgi:ABC-type multidrug transport system fused ATPase/permease subunit